MLEGPSDVLDAEPELDDSSAVLEGFAVVVTSTDDPVGNNPDVTPATMLVTFPTMPPLPEEELAASLAVAVGLPEVDSAELLKSSVVVGAGRMVERSPKREVICPAIPLIPLATLELSASDSDVVVASPFPSVPVSVADGASVTVGRSVVMSPLSVKIPREVVVSDALAGTVGSATSLEVVSLTAVAASAVSVAVELAEVTASVGLGRSPLTIDTIPPKRPVDEAGSVVDDASVVVVSAAEVVSVEKGAVSLEGESVEEGDATERVVAVAGSVEVPVEASVEDALGLTAVGRSVEMSLVRVAAPSTPLLVAVEVTLAVSSLGKVVEMAEPTASVAFAAMVPLTVPLVVWLAAAAEKPESAPSPLPF